MLASQQALAFDHAGLIFQPYLGYTRASTSAEVATSGDNGSATWFSLAGYNYGLTLGYQFGIGLILGADYLRSNLSGSGQGTSEAYYTGSYSDVVKRSYSMNQLGLLAGLHLGNLGLAPFRIWGTYLVSSTLSDSGSYNSGGTGSSSAGYKLGAGFLMSKVLSLNLEYSDTKLVSKPTGGAQGKEQVQSVNLSLGMNFDQLFLGERRY